MKYETMKLEELCTIKTGTPMSRAKAAASEDGAQPVRVLIPRAMSEGVVVDDELATEMVGNVKSELYTHENDVIIKLSTPHDAVYIDAEHEGVLVTSFGMILRVKEGAPLSMQYLSMFLNHPETRSKLQAVSTGITAGMNTLKRRTVADIVIPLPPLERQEKLAELYAAINERKRQYRRLIELGDELVASQMTETVNEE